MAVRNSTTACSMVRSKLHFGHVFCDNGTHSLHPGHFKGRTSEFSVSPFRAGMITSIPEKRDEWYYKWIKWEDTGLRIPEVEFDKVTMPRSAQPAQMFLILRPAFYQK